MNRLPVAAFGQRAKAEALQARLMRAGVHSEIHDELRLEKLWSSASHAPFLRQEVLADHFDRACALLHEWDAKEGALRDALRSPECKSLRVTYPQFTRKFFLPNLALGIMARLGALEKQYYCEDCHFTWPREGSKPRRNRPNMAPYYFIEGIEQTSAGNAPPEEHRQAA
jgi:hypothetical protein